MNEIDTYIENLSREDYNIALQDLRKVILEILPDAVECISYGMPAFRVNGKVVAGFSAFKNHLTFFPFSGSTLSGMENDLEGWDYTKSGVHFTPEKPIPKELIKKIITKRLSEIS